MLAILASISGVLLIVILLAILLDLPLSVYNLFTYFEEFILQNTLLSNVWYARIIALAFATLTALVFNRLMHIFRAGEVRIATVLGALIFIGFFGLVGYLEDHSPDLSICVNLSEIGIKNRKKEARIWYYQNPDSTLEFYKLPFHPLHGTDLKPLSEEVVQRVRDIYKKGLVRQMILTCGNPGIISIRRNDVIGSYSGKRGENGEFFYLELMPRNGTDSLTSTIKIGDERPVEISCYYDPQNKILWHPLLGEAIVSGQQIGNSLVVELTSNLQNPIPWNAKKMPEQI